MNPLKNFVLVVDAEDTNPNQTAGGIILSAPVDTKTSKPGFVINVGPQVENVKKKDKIALDWSKGMPITVEGEKALLVAEQFIYGVY